MRRDLGVGADLAPIKRRLILAAYFAISAAYFCVQFVLLQNWDMQVRILIADHLFHGGFYFEPERELLESLIIGALSYPLGGLAVYGYIVVGDLLLFLAVLRFSRVFGVDPVIAIALLLNPFFLMYGVMNGSEIYLLSFLILTIAEICTASYLGGVFLALAFLSKYDALYFVILFAFYFARRRAARGLGLLAANLALFVAALLPYLAYNLLAYGNLFATFALSYLNFGVTLGSLPYFVYQGLLELLIPVAALAWIALARRSSAAEMLRGRLAYGLLLLVAFLVGIYIYFKTRNLMVGGLGTYRWGLMALTFSLLFVAMLAQRRDAPIFMGASLVFFAAAAVLLAASYTRSYPDQREARIAVAAFKEVYGTTRCTVLSNDWVPLDYYGLPAAPLPHFDEPYSGHPIVSLGRSATSLPLLERRGNVYIYGDRSWCTFSPVEVSFLARTNALLRHEGKPPMRLDPCHWLFGIAPALPAVEGACVAVNTLLASAVGVPAH